MEVERERRDTRGSTYSSMSASTAELVDDLRRAAVLRLQQRGGRECAVVSLKQLFEITIPGLRIRALHIIFTAVLAFILSYASKGAKQIQDCVSVHFQEASGLKKSEALHGCVQGGGSRKLRI